jgi:protein-disulfide isomerase
VLEQYPNDVKLVFKKMNAAIGSLAANQQGKFWEFHSELFKNYNKLNDEMFDEIAKSLELDMEQFKQDMQNPALAAMVQRDLKDGGQAGVRGTPSIFVNGRMLKQRSLPGFKQVIDEELAKKKEK